MKRNCEKWGKNLIRMIMEHTLFRSQMQDTRFEILFLGLSKDLEVRT